MAEAVTIVIAGQRYTIQVSPVSGDVSVTPAGVSTIGSGAVTLDMIQSSLHKYLLPVAVVGQGIVG